MIFFFLFCLLILELQFNLIVFIAIFDSNPIIYMYLFVLLLHGLKKKNNQPPPPPITTTGVKRKTKHQERETDKEKKQGNSK